ncbi:TfoX/Sxy family protein [Pseudogemmobacter faecipullorum]|uniref:TfoX/Sxy family protein n=1 Tax=Pseudogemmobacter faecipullorum TaxID=2755041 RepID=A0ABS8CKS0_9RHOB|nr:TfoX/Sxy family protein [Pseudogemmobacter faecipullorum]MCB5409753.1 TfoX/Sxy family protein [Pseudogemmobacter faecipullorum]
MSAAPDSLPETDDAPVSSIRNLGPASEAGFLRAGITSAGALRAIGAEEGYRRLLLAGSRPHFIGFYVLVMALQGRPWNDCKGEEKKALRRRFDQICREVKSSGGGRNYEFEAKISQFGVVRRPG